MDLWVPPICGSILSKICSLNFSHSANSELHPLTPQSNKIVVCCFNSNCPIPYRLGSSLREKAIINVDFTQYVSLQILSAFGHFLVPSNNCLSVFHCSSGFFVFVFLNCNQSLEFLSMDIFVLKQYKLLLHYQNQSYQKCCFMVDSIQKLIWKIAL